MRHCRTVLQRAMVPPHQLQKFFVVLICVLPNGPPHLQMALSTESSVPKGGAGGGTGVPGATGFLEQQLLGWWEEEEVAGRWSVCCDGGGAALRSRAASSGLGVPGAGGLP